MTTMTVFSGYYFSSALLNSKKRKKKQLLTWQVPVKRCAISNVLIQHTGHFFLLGSSALVLLLPVYKGMLQSDLAFDENIRYGLLLAGARDWQIEVSQNLLVGVASGEYQLALAGIMRRRLPDTQYKSKAESIWVIRESKCV